MIPKLYKLKYCFDFTQKVEFCWHENTFMAFHMEGPGLTVSGGLNNPFHRD